MRRSKEINVFNIAFLDLLSGALGAVIILFIAVPKAKEKSDHSKEIKISKIEEKTSKEKQPRKISSIDDSREKQLSQIIKSQTEAIEELKKQSQKTKSDENEKMDLVKKVLTLKDQNQELKDENQELKGKVSEMQQQAKNSNALNKFNPSLSSNRSIDVGFKFKGKRILFILDISGSMVQEERISHVKAGLKMLITSMSPNFKIDVVSFPSPSGGSYKELWGNLKNTTEANKVEIFRYLYSLRPNGRTPTRDALKFAFKNYYGLSDIVLLTDGVPTNTVTGNPDDIYSILHQVSRLNTSRIQINAIGVGSDFLKQKENKAYIFLERLTQQNKGFFVGF